MAQPQLQAQFFVRPNGVVIRKAPDLTYRERKAIKARDKDTCQICGVSIGRLGRDTCPFDELKQGQIDHIFPRARGGQNDQTNLRLLCVLCNASKGAK
jgi:5-methylcytosine-specific restriction endonuclease McrA